MKIISDFTSATPTIIVNDIEGRSGVEINVQTPTETISYHLTVEQARELAESLSRYLQGKG